MGKHRVSPLAKDELKLAFLSCGISRHFASLSDCVHYLYELYGPAAPDPAYLFRGESGIFDTTHSSRARIDIDFRGRLEQGQAGFVDLAAYCAQELAQLKPYLSAMQITGFLQHYGLPTYALDLTADLTVAASFGSFGATNRIKLIAVVNKEKLLATRDRLVDLHSGVFGQRPGKQRAFITHLEPMDNFKSPGMAGLLGIRWYSYVLTEKDQGEYNGRRRYLSEGEPVYINLVPNLIGKYELIHGRVHRAIKRYFDRSEGEISKAGRL